MAVRRQLVKHRVVVKRVDLTSAAKRLAGRSHFHGCLTCRRVYEDFCETPEVNAACRPCQGKRRSVWDADRDPHPCCVDNTTQVTSGEKAELYLLAGPGPWFQCRTCARCHPTPVLGTNHKEST